MRQDHRTGAILIACCALLTACAPDPPFEEVTDPFAEPLPAAQPVTSTPLDATSELDPGAVAEGSDVVTAAGPGDLVERLPNTCQLENYQQLVGLEGVAAQAQVFDRPARVITPTAIVSQVYDPRRVNLYTDERGTVRRISCG